MSQLSALLVLSCLLALAAALPDPRLQQRLLQQRTQRLQQQYPYLVFGGQRGRANGAHGGAVVQGFELVEQPEDDDDDDEDDMPLRRLQQANDDDDDDELANNNNDAEDDDDNENVDEDDLIQRGAHFARNGQLMLLNGSQDQEEQEDDDDEEQLPLVLAKPGFGRKSGAALSGQQLLKNARPTQMMVARDQAGAIMVPDGIIEIEGQSVVDEKTGKAALLVPRAALDAIPDGAVVALMERSALGAGVDSSVGEERANRVVVRRRKTGARRNVQRRRRGGRPVRRRSGVRRRVPTNNRRRNVRVVRPNVNRRRGGAQRRRGQLVLQG